MILPSRRNLVRTVSWNGRTAAGEDALPGEYRIRVKAYVNGETYEQVSDIFELTEPMG